MLKRTRGRIPSCPTLSLFLSVAAGRQKLIHIFPATCGPDAAVPLDIQAFVARYLLSSSVKAGPVFFHCHAGLMAVDCETDAFRQQEMKDELKQTIVAYARALLAGKSEKELQRLLRQPAKRSQEQESAVRIQHGSLKSDATMPVMKIPDYAEMEAREIDRLPLSHEFDVRLLRTSIK